MKRVVIITGAGNGIGLACARRLNRDGYTVYGISLHGREGEAFPVYACDVADGEKIKRIFESVFETEGRIDALINSAGFGISGAAECCAEELVDRMCAVNFSAVIKLCAAVIPYLRESGGGNIINIGSVASLVPIPFQSCYSAVKAGTENFSRALAAEVKGFNIGVTCVLPGDTATGFTAARIKTEQNNELYGGKIKKSVEKMERDETRGKSPETVAKAVIKILKRKRPPLRVTVGFSYKLIVFLTRILPVSLVNKIVSAIYT